MRSLVAVVVLVFTGVPGLQAASPLKVASYNVENYLPMDRMEDGKNLQNAPKPEKEIAAVVQVIASESPDILGLIEMGDQGMLEDLRSRLKAAGLDYPHSEWVAGADPHRHVALLSRFPIVERNSRDDVTFELDGKVQRINRGILDVTVQVTPDYALRLVGAHLKSRREVPEFDQAQFRAKEAWHLRQHLTSILAANPKTNLLCFGDFNDTKNEYPIRELIGTRGTPEYMMDLWAADSRKERWTHYWKSADIYSRIDYLLVSPALTREVHLNKSGICDLPAWEEASDHRLLYTIITPQDK
jgi:endonuclease/exonuclease/phosphatase family metal-dependent hydrolase